MGLRSPSARSSAASTIASIGLRTCGVGWNSFPDTISASPQRPRLDLAAIGQRAAGDTSDPPNRLHGGPGDKLGQRAVIGRSERHPTRPPIASTVAPCESELLRERNV